MGTNIYFLDKLAVNANNSYISRIHDSVNNKLKNSFQEIRKSG